MHSFSGVGLIRPGRSGDRPITSSPVSPQNLHEEYPPGNSKTAADAARLFGLHRSNITRLLERSTTPTR